MKLGFGNPEDQGSGGNEDWEFPCSVLPYMYLQEGKETLPWCK